MELKIIGSGSSGNTYVLKSSTGQSLILDAGCQFAKVQKYLDYKTQNVQGVLITHEHGDHCIFWKSYFDAGINIIVNEKTAVEIGSEKFQNNNIENNSWYKFGEFTILSFGVNHDAVDPVNFIIKHEEIGVLIYVTDTKTIPIPEKTPNHWLIEANYSDENLDVLARRNLFLANRIEQNHMSINETIEILKLSKSQSCKSITLCHLSNDNSDAYKFKRKVFEAIGIVPNIAVDGLEIQL